MENKKRALGKGLEQLFSDSVIDFDAFEDNIVKEDSKDVTEINLDDIRTNPYQPRKNFDIESLNELADSIKEYGIIQPIIVKKSIKGYELVAGERRTKAAKLAGLTKIPAIIKDFNDDEMMEIALLENIQREDLNPIEEAISIDNIIKLRGYTQEEFAKKFGKSRTYITNILGLLRLPEEVKKLVENNKLSMSHARVLSKLDNDEKIIDLASKVVSDEISVHELEKLASENSPVAQKRVKNKPFNTTYRLYENLLLEKLDSKVKINNNKIEIYFDGKKDLERILEELDVKIEDE